LTTAATTIVSGSIGTVYKINNITVSNLDGSSSFNFNLNHVNANGASIPFAYQVTVPADASLDIISKSIYLEEGDSLRLTANTASKLEAICSYEEIS
ncbi:hypothetical protein, partial [Escherichia coli]|uniref:hypothetical protein n=1 Tax=Escherichia coli TaxID=562 RepID=UPI00200E03BE